MAGSAAASAQLLLEFQQVQAHRAQLYAKFNAGFRDYLEHGQEQVFARLMQELTPAFNEVSKQVIHIESFLKSSAVDRADLASLLRQVQELERNKLRLTLSWQALRAAHAAGRFSWQVEADRCTIRPKHAHEQQHQQQLQAMLQQLQLEQQQQTGAAANGFGTDASGRNDQQRSGSGQVDGFMSIKPGFYEQQLQQATAAAAAASQQQDSTPAVQNGHQHHGCCGHSHDQGHGEHDPLDCNELEPTEAEYTAAVKEALQELDSCVSGINEVLEEVKYAIQDLQEG